MSWQKKFDVQTEAAEAMASCQEQLAEIGITVPID
jgi:hypothetical protein